MTVGIGRSTIGDVRSTVASGLWYHYLRLHRRLFGLRALGRIVFDGLEDSLDLLKEAFDPLHFGELHMAE